MVTLGIALLAIGAGLLVAEAHLPTYGVLGVAGFAVLVLVLPLAILARCRSVRELRQTVGAHRILAWAYAAIAVGARNLMHLLSARGVNRG